MLGSGFRVCGSFFLFKRVIFRNMFRALRAILVWRRPAWDACV